LYWKLTHFLILRQILTHVRSFMHALAGSCAHKIHSLSLLISEKYRSNSVNPSPIPTYHVQLCLTA